MKRGGSVSGAVSLVMIFCVLCLAIFSVLSYATAQREEKLAKLSESRAHDYYNADYTATSIVYAFLNGRDVDVDYAVETGSDGDIYEFSVPAGGEQVLSVRVRVNGDSYEILRWQTLYEGEWEIDESLDVWDGEDDIF